MKTAIVTDSSSGLTSAESVVQVVRMHVSIDGVELVGPVATDVVSALRARRRVATAAPTPRELLSAYRLAAAAGAQGVVSIHVSGALSGACAAAHLAARDAPIPVTVVDSRTVSAALGLTVAAAVRAAQQDREPDDVAGLTATFAAGTRVLFSVEDLDALRRGGRISSLAAWLGSALLIKPLLEIADGRVVAVEKLRTSARVQAALANAASAHAEQVGAAAQVVVEHCDGAAAAGALVERLRAMGIGVTEIVEMDPVVGVHVGAGALAVVVAPPA